MIRTSPQQYFEEQPQNTNRDYYPILLGVLIGGLIAITVIAIIYRK